MKRYSSSFLNMKMKNETTVKYYFICIRLTELKIFAINHSLICGKIVNFIHCEKCKITQILLRAIWKYVDKVADIHI